MCKSEFNRGNTTLENIPSQSAMAELLGQSLFEVWQELCSDIGEKIRNGGIKMQYKYIRIQGREDSWITKYPKGIFSMCWRLIQDGKMSQEDEKKFKEIDEWFKENLPEPEPCKNGEKVITFFKTETTDEMQKVIEHAIKLLDKYAHPYDVVYTNFVGTIIYEDKWQVAVRVENGKMI